MDSISLKDRIKDFLICEYGKTVEESSKEEIYFAISRAIRDSFIKKWQNSEKDTFLSNKKQAYYLSAEFLMGRFLGNNIINLKKYENILDILENIGIDYNEIEDAEIDAGLGNGGLGRLAACFLDSAATHKLPMHGYGIRYKYGIFKQDIENGYQIEMPNNWLKFGNPWELERKDETIEVKFGGRVEVNFKSGEAHFIQQDFETVIATPFDYPVIGYGGEVINTLRLWNAHSPNYFDLALFNNGQYRDAIADQSQAKNISRILYPNDNHIQGKVLRLRQQYFFVSASLQDVVRKFKKYVGTDFTKFSDYVAFQLNDTHPITAIPEFMRILMDQENYEWDEAWEITTKCFAYTNHTLMQEALEKWPIDTFRALLPRVYQIIEEINRRHLLALQIKYPGDFHKYNRMSILGDGMIKMAWLGIVGSFSVNGVAALHTELLKNQVLNEWYQYYPEKFNNKTNGVTQRRWLLKSNKDLSNLINSKIGDSWINNLMHLKELAPYIEDDNFINDFLDVKDQNKLKLAQVIEKITSIKVDPKSIFDVQVKRLHEYKRQLLNIMHVIYLYNKLKKDPNLDIVPRTFIFSAKAASGYYRAKLIIKLINSVADRINNDPTIKGKIKVVFLKNYNVSLAEKIFPASDISEQISTASMEASGTGNMKFMINGALTLGTMDGANIEIVEEVGSEHAFIFGLKSEEVIHYQKTGSYNPWDIYNNDAELREVLEQIKNGYFSPEHPNLFNDLWSSLLYGSDGGRPDPYFVLKDFRSYLKAQEKVDKYYRDRKLWAKSAILNVAYSGKFSSDRTIKQYSEEIWDIEPIK